MQHFFSRPVPMGSVALRAARLRRWILAASVLGSLFTPDLARAADKSGVTPDRLHLPQGPGSLEGVGENVEPNLNMGLLTYRVPIELPPGYPGLTPELALTYNSGAGNSELGIGWSLSLPTIERMTSRGLPRFSADDVFAANGSDELVRVDDRTYRARYEKAFVRYTWYDGEEGTEGYFTAEYPDGRVGYFGAASNGELVSEARERGRDGVFRYHLVDLVDVLGHVVRYTYEKDGEVARLDRVAYVSDGDSARYEVRLGYEERPDPLSDAKSGVVLRRSERIAQIRVLVRGSELKRYELDYEDTGTSGGFSRLSRVRWFGTQGESAFPIAFRFAYSASLATAEPRLVTVDGALGLDFRTGNADFVDLNGDCLPDVVDTSGSNQRIFLNALGASGAQRFLSAVTSATGTSKLAEPATEMFDLDGDGRSDMVDAENRVVLWNRGGGDWDEAEELDTLDVPSLAEDGNLRFFDYDDDKRTDLLHIDRTGAWVYANQGGGSFRLIDEGIDSVGASFVEDHLQLADMNGDGLADVVRIATDLVSYRTNLGLGHWGDWIEVDGVPDDLVGDEQLVDLNGDSLADLVAVRADAVSYAVNRDGARFAPLEHLRATDELPLPERTSDTSLRFADMNGSGSTDIVWIDASGAVTYLELFPERPNLLTHIDNGIGKVIDIDYGSSSEHLRRDDGDWALRLPHPMLTIDEIVVRDELSGVEQRSSFHYRNGYYDGAEKQFRGFRDVTVETPGDASIDDGVRQVTFDVGLEDGYRKGLLLREAFESGGRALEETERSYDDCEIAGVGETTPAVRFLCPTRVVETVKEGRPEPEWATIEQRFDHDGYGNRTLTAKLGVTSIGGEGCGACGDAAGFGAPCDDDCRGDEAYESASYVAPRSGSPWILRRLAKAREYADPESNVYRERTYYYDGDAFVGLPAGELELGLLTRVSARVEATSDETVDLERYRRDVNGIIVGSLDPDGRRRSYEYDADGLLLQAETVLIDGGEREYSLEMSVEYDPVLEFITRSSAWRRFDADGTDSSERATRYAYDEFGRIAAIARPGDSLDAPTEAYVYDIGSPVSRIVRRARSTRGGAADLEEVQCFDGAGRKLQTRTRIAKGRYEVSGFSSFNVAGLVASSYQAYSGEGAECDTSPPAGVLAEESLYDAKSRLLRVKRADAKLYGSASLSETEYFPLRNVLRDEEDTLASGAHSDTPEVRHLDGLGRVVAVDRYLEPDERLRTQFGYAETGELSGFIDAAGNGKTQTYDLLGRVVRVEDPDSGVTTFRYDGAGHVLEKTDARGVTAVASYDSAGRKLAEWEQGNESATRIEYSYDVSTGCDACRNVEGSLAGVTYPLADDRSERGVEEFGYSDRAEPSYVARTLGGTRFEFFTDFDNAGRVVAARYPAGFQLEYERDGAGRVTRVSDYVPEVTYDERGRIASFALGNGVTSSYEYDPLDRLARIDTLAPGDLTLQATRFTRDRVGNVVAASDASVPADEPSVNGVYEYDSLYRLVRAHLDPERDQSETLDFAYDALDNIVEKTSNRDNAEHVGPYTYGEDGAGPHAVTSAGGRTLRYDAAGRLLERDGVRFEWDFLGRLVGARTEGEAGVRSWYGPAEQRVKKTERGQTIYYPSPDFEVRDGTAVLYVRVGEQRVAKLVRGDFAARFLPDLAPANVTGDVVVPEPDGTTTAADAWISAAALAGTLELDPSLSVTAAREDTLGELLAASARRLLLLPPASGEIVTYAVSDQLGSVVAVTGAEGELLERRASYPFGGDRSSAPPLDTDYTFTGKERDFESGFIYFGARYYSSELGAFVTPDPAFEVVKGIGNAESYNRYLYALNNPLVRVDPDGFQSTEGGKYEVYFFDQGKAPADAGKEGTSYTAEIYVKNLETGKVSGPYRGSTYPNSGDTVAGKKAPYTGNMVDEGTHSFNNESGHKSGTRKGLNLVNDEGERLVPGKNVQSGKDTEVKYANVHSGTSDKGNYNSRGSEGCLTIRPKDADAFFSNFDWTKRGVTGTSSGQLTIYRGTSIGSTVERSILKVEQWLER